MNHWNRLRQELFKLFAASVVILFQGGCGPNAEQNLAPLRLRIPPTVKSYELPSLVTSNYKTFSVLPASAYDRNAQLRGIEESQMLFALRNVFEAHGYRFVELNASPDFIASIDGSSQFESTYVPPESVTVPTWTPGQSITSYGTVANLWGAYAGSYSATTYVPGQLSSSTYTRPGFTVAAHYPSVRMAVMDARQGRVVWTAAGTGCSDNDDFRISSQMVIAAALEKFPRCAFRGENYPTRGDFGIQGAVFTLDGNHFIPVVLDIARGGSASRAGLQKGDILLAIDGVETTNKSFSEVAALLDRQPATAARLTLWRVDKKVELTIKPNPPRR